MNRWIGKVAIVTGASSGIGAQIAVDLANAGVKVVGCARRADRVNELKSKVKPEFKKNLFAQKCDVTDEANVKSVFAWIEKELGGVDICVNNAGCVRITNIVDADNTQQIKDVLDTNLWGSIYCIREAFQSMKKRKVNGHVILMNSILGHTVPFFVGLLPSFNIYPPAKHALTAMTEVLRQEFMAMGTKVKITSISPGAVRTDIFYQDQLEALDKKGVPFLDPVDISNAVLYALGTPPHVQVHELTIKPVGEPY